MVMDSLGIDVDASDSDNMRTFKRVTVGTEVFKYEEGEQVFNLRVLKVSSQAAKALPSKFPMKGARITCRYLVI